MFYFCLKNTAGTELNHRLPILDSKYLTIKWNKIIYGAF
jgi:hypothetical protein